MAIGLSKNQNFQDSTAQILDDGDNTKIAKFDASGITTGTTRTFTFPDASIILGGSTAALTSGRLPVVTTGGVLSDDAGLLYDTANNALRVGTTIAITNGNSVYAGQALYALGISSAAVLGSTALEYNAGSDIGAIRVTHDTGGGLIPTFELQLTDATFGVVVTPLTAYGTELVVNEAGSATIDFRAEGDTNANLFFVDASTDRVGFGTATPGAFVHINTPASGAETLQRWTVADDATAKLEIVNATGSAGSFIPTLQAVGDAGDGIALIHAASAGSDAGGDVNPIQVIASYGPAFASVVNRDLLEIRNQATAVITVAANGDTTFVGSITSANSITTGGQTVNRTASAAGNYTILLTDYIIGKTGITGGGDTVTLPAAATAGEGKLYVIKDESGTAGTNNITIDGNGAETIDGVANFVMISNYQAIQLYSDGSNWFVY